MWCHNLCIYQCSNLLRLIVSHLCLHKHLNILDWFRSVMVIPTLISQFICYHYLCHINNNLHCHMSLGFLYLEAMEEKSSQTHCPCLNFMLTMLLTTTHIFLPLPLLGMVWVDHFLYQPPVSWKYLWENTGPFLKNTHFFTVNFLSFPIKKFFVFVEKLSDMVYVFHYTHWFTFITTTSGTVNSLNELLLSILLVIIQKNLCAPWRFPVFTL